MTEARYVRYSLNDETGHGAVLGDEIRRLDAPPWENQTPGTVVGMLGDVTLLSPCLPTKIVAIGLNYASHAAELGKALPSEPLMFLKPPSSVIGPDAAIVYPHHLSQQVDYEAELAVVIGRQARRVSSEEAEACVFGYTCANDVTARDLQNRDAQWNRSKGFDTFCPLGPWICTGVDVSDLAIRCTVNGSVRQDGRTSDLVFGVHELVARISDVMTLVPGDVILTGTPSGIGPVVPGDRIAVEVEGLGVLENEVL